MKNYKPCPSNFWITPRVENKLDFDKNKKSIIVAGCSFTYGSGIPENENISSKLQKLTGRKVYNRGLPGYGPQASLKDIQTSDFFGNDKTVEPEYYIYTFISDHLRRMYVDYDISPNERYNLYTIRNNKLIPKPDKMTLMDYIQITELVKWINHWAYYFVPDDRKFDRLKLYFYTMRKELLKKYPNIKMVILVYHPNLDTVETHNIKPFRTERWKELEKDGFIVLRFDTPEFDYLKEKMYISPEDNVHPSGKAWDKLVPIIIEKLGMNNNKP